MKDWNFYLALTMRQIVAFAVPVFFFAAGYWGNMSFDKNQSFTSMMLCRIKRLAFPYLFWSLLAIALAFPLGFGTVVVKLLTGTAIFPFYFIVALAQMFFILPLLRNVGYSGKAHAAIAAVNILALGINYLWHYRAGHGLPPQLFVLWIYYFYLGMAYQAQGENRDRIPAKLDLVHMFVLPHVGLVLKSNASVYGFQPVFQVFCIAITLSICVVIIYTARGTLPKVIWRNVLGFE